MEFKRNGSQPSGKTQVKYFTGSDLLIDGGFIAALRSIRLKLSG
jgi:hypothetical protein